MLAANPEAPRLAPGVWAHPFTALSAAVAAALPAFKADPGTIRVRLPAIDNRPLPSSTLARATGRLWAGESEDGLPPAPPVIQTFEVSTLALTATDAANVVPMLSEMLEGEAELSTDEAEPQPARHPVAGASFQYFAAAIRLARHLLVQQRFVPSLVQTAAGELRGAWQGWMSDEATAYRLSGLVSSMPVSARCAEDHNRHDGGAITQEFVHAIVDAQCRATLESDGFPDSISERDPAADPHVAWLGGLLSANESVKAGAAVRQEMVRRVRGWIGVLEERGASSAWRLLMRLREPEVAGLAPNAAPDPNDAVWIVTFHLQAVEQPSLVIDAVDVWQVSGDSVTIMGRRLDQPTELLLGELGRASRLYKRLEDALEETQPSSLALHHQAGPTSSCARVRPVALGGAGLRRRRSGLVGISRRASGRETASGVRRRQPLRSSTRRPHQRRQGPDRPGRAHRL